MTTDFPTAPSAYGLNGPSAAVTVEKSPHASHTEILTPPVEPKLFDAFCAVFKATIQDEEAVNAIAKLARKSQVVEVAVTL